VEREREQVQTEALECSAGGPSPHHRITASLHHDSNVAVNALRPTKWREVRFVVLVRLPRAELRHVVPWAQTLS